MLEQALASAARLQADRLAGQGSIFDLGPVEEERPRHHPQIPTDEFEKNELLRLEKEALGLYVSEHPLSAIRDQLAQDATRRWPTSSAGATARSSPSAASSRGSSS